jgi:hypothetical protein
MVISIKVVGKMVENMDMDYLHMQMEMHIMEIGKIEENMEKVFLNMLMVVLTKVNFLMVFLMVQE